MDSKKAIKVDNWSLFFLQKLQKFFNNTDYCDLTLQFNDNTQLKVHRLVLNTCTDYFRLLEKQYNVMNGVLIMPADMQSDIVVPIVHFMYSGILEFEINLFNRIFNVVQKMNITVLLKLLRLHRLHKINMETGTPLDTFPENISYKSLPLNEELNLYKFNAESLVRIKKPLSLSLQKCYHKKNKEISILKSPPKKILKIDNSKICQYPERDDSTKHLTPSYIKPSCSPVMVNKYDQNSISVNNESTHIKDHTRIISEVLKKYPNFLKNSNIKIIENKKIESYESPTIKNISEYETDQKENAVKSQQKSEQLTKSQTTAVFCAKSSVTSAPGQRKHINSKTMHALIAQGAENTTGPWLCLKCGVNGRPISIPSYRRFRHHLTNSHKEKIDCRLCKHCGWRSSDNKTLMNHVLTNHKNQLNISVKAAHEGSAKDNSIIDCCDNDTGSSPIRHKTNIFHNKLLEEIDLTADCLDIQELKVGTMDTTYSNELKEFDDEESKNNNNESDYLELMKFHIIVEGYDEEMECQKPDDKSET